MKKINTRLLSWLLAICMILPVMAQTAIFSVDAEEAIPSVKSSGFEAENSFLTQEQYQALGFSLRSAQSSDKDSGMHPLMYLNDSNVKYNGVEYGWSNPQVIAVMLSAPYWNELDYGSDMSSAGETSFTISSGVETGSSAECQLSLQVSLTVQNSTEVAGNGFELGCSFSGAIESAVEVQKAKTTTKEMSFTAGAGEDYVALVVFPVAVYEYQTVVGGHTQYIYVNVQLDPVSCVTTLDVYNSVVREYNRTRTSDAVKLTQINMDTIHPGYHAGDPTTGFSGGDKFPARFTVKYNQLVPAEDTGSLGNNQLAGKTYVSGSPYNINLNSNASGGRTLTVEASSGATASAGVMLSASVFGGLKVGFDGFGVETETSIKAELTAETGVSVSSTVINSGAITYSMTFAGLPTSAQTGQSMGVATSDYSFQASLFVWTPNQRGSAVSIAPRFIGSIVEFPDPSNLPLYLPDDLHASQISRDSVTLSWTNPDFSQEPFHQRVPTYSVYTTATGSASNYTKIEAVAFSEDGESCTITGLEAGTEYIFALGAANDSKTGVIGPSVTVTTVGHGLPNIIRQPEDITVTEGEKPILTVEAEPNVAGSPLTYQWYQLQLDKYGTYWAPVIGATSSSFNAAYYAQDGVVNSANRYDLDGTVYHCLITESHGATSMSIVSDAVTLSIANSHYIRTYEDLLQLSEAVARGDKEAAAGHYTQLNDITCPSGQNWGTPIGSNSIPFTGTYDGQGHTISGLTGDLSVDNGLFGVINNATVKDLKLENVNLMGDYVYVGGICGKAQNSLISNCTVSGAVGVSAGEGGYGAGGICGYAYTGTVIEKCINYSALQTQADHIGGICAVNRGEIINCANFGDLRFYSPYFDHWPSTTYGGGIAGANYGSVTSCYNAGTLTGLTQHYCETAPVCHKNGASNSYYVNSINNASGGRTEAQFHSGEVTYLLNCGATAGEDVWYQNLDNGLTPDPYPTLTNNGKNTVYKVDMADKTYSNNDGRFEITTPQELMEFAALVNGGNPSLIGILMADIDMSGITDYVPIGQTGLYYNGDPAADGNWGYRGTFEGNGHVIKNLSIIGSSSDDLSYGLFGTLSGTVRNLGVEDFTYTGAGKDSRVGAIAGQVLAGGMITDCYLNGGQIDTQVNTTQGVAGGIAGSNYAGTVQNCYVNNLVAKAGRAGGIVGDNYGDGNSADGTDRPGTVTNCYTSTGALCNRGTGTGYANVSAALYASGEITWLLGSVWKQAENDLPGFKGDTIYQNTCEGDIFYATTDTDYETHELSGVRCVNCGNFDAPILVTEDNYASLGLDESYIGFYAISNASQFYWFSQRDAMKDITGGIVLLENVLLSNDTEPWNPINVDGSFAFDGRGHTLTLKLDFGTEQSSSSLALFGNFNYATVKNLILRGNVTGCTTNHMGGLAGSMYRSTVSGVISFADVTNSCQSSGSAGGLAGYFGGQHSNGLYSLIQNCAVYADIAGYHAGGIVGYGWGGWQYYDIKGAAYKGNVTGYGHGGAIIGYHNNNQTATYCTFTDIYYCETDGLGFSGGGNTNYTLGSDVAQKTKQQFASGEVAYLLNRGRTDGTQVWYQNLDNGQLPNLHPLQDNSGNNTVYPILNAKQKDIRGYSNYQHDCKASVLQRTELRVYYRLMEEDGGISPDSRITYGYGLVDNAQKTITVFTTTKAGRIGLLGNQGTNGTVGVLTLNGYTPSKLTSQQILAAGYQEEDIYVDASGCIFIKVPDDPSTLPELTLTYTNKETADYTPTEYKLIVKMVDLSMFQTVGASSTYRLSSADPDYDVIYTEPFPETGDMDYTLFCILLAAALVTIVVLSYKKKPSYCK